MDSFTKEFQIAQNDHIIRGLVELSQVENLIAVEDTDALRRIAAVVGGKFNEGSILIRRVKTFLDNVRTSMNRVVTHAGFSSSGVLTDALNHPSFVEATNSMDHGLVFEQVSNYYDPATVLVGAKELLDNAFMSLQYVYKSESVEAIMARGQGTEGTLYNAISRATRFSSTREGPTLTVSSELLTGYVAVNHPVYTSTVDKKPIATAGARTMVTGPRTVLKDVEPGAGTQVRYSGYYEGSLCSAVNSDLNGTLARFAIVAPPAQSSGACAFSNEYYDDVSYNHDKRNCLVAQPSDADISHLFATPRSLGNMNVATTGVFPKWWGEEATALHPAHTYLGCNHTSILIPLSGLEDMTSGGNNLGGTRGKLTSWIGTTDVNEQGANDITAHTGLTTSHQHSGSLVGFDGDDALESMIDVDALVSIAEKAGLGLPKYDVLIFEIMVLNSYTEGIIDTRLNVQKYLGRHSFIVNSQVTVDALPKNAASVIQSRKIDASVAMVRELYDDSLQVKRAKAYSRYCTRLGRNDPAMVLFRAMLTEQVRKNLSVLGSTFRSAQGGAAQLIAGISAADFASGATASVTISQSDIDLFLKPMASTTWIGPNRMPSSMVALDETRKFGIFQRWLRILDYIVFESLLDLEFNQNFSD